jgi:hypothetical protein
MKLRLLQWHRLGAEFIAIAIAIKAFKIMLSGNPKRKSFKIPFGFFTSKM